MFFHRIFVLLAAAIFVVNVGAANLRCDVLNKIESAEAVVENVVEKIPTPLEEAVERWRGNKAASELKFLVQRINVPGARDRQCGVGKVELIEAKSVLDIEWRCQSGRGGAVVYSNQFLVCEKQDIPVAIQDISHHKVLDANDIVFERRWVDYADKRKRIKDGFLSSTVYRASRFMRKGQALDVSAIEALPQVIRNKAVVVRVMGPDLSVELSGTALSDGHVGDTVRVRNGMNGKLFDATVDGIGSATLTLK